MKKQIHWDDGANDTVVHGVVPHSIQFATVSIHLSAEELVLVGRAAKESGESLATFVRKTVLAAIKE